MSEEIICECGHSKWYHLNRCGAMGCGCGLSKEAVEARYWARRIMKEKGILQQKYNIIVAVLKSMGFWDETCDYSMGRLDKG